MNYQETLDYLFSALPMFHRVGAAAYKANLDNAHALCNALEHPEKGLVCIHIAGTNGKGSTSHMLASIFQEAGFKTGLYTSPHLKDFRERIKINGVKVEEEWVASFINQNKNKIDSIQPSFFEMSTIMAFQYFKEQKTDIAIIETGLGGRLDTTNVIQPEISVITNIGYDHMNLLGDTLEKIASEKAGIIKPYIPVVIGEFREETKPVFVQQAEKCRANISFAQENFIVTSLDFDTTKSTQKIVVKRKLDGVERYFDCDLTGNYQLKNIATVIQTLELLNKNKFPITEEQITAGLRNVKRNTGLMGRWQILQSSPLTICDTGHNEDGIREVLKMIAATPHQQLHFVLGMVNDKEIEKILNMLPKDALYYFCKANIPRGLDVAELSSKAMSCGLNGSIHESVMLALKAAQANSSVNDLVFVGGSTFIVAEVV